MQLEFERNIQREEPPAYLLHPVFGFGRWGLGCGRDKEGSMDAGGTKDANMKPVALSEKNALPTSFILRFR